MPIPFLIATELDIDICKSARARLYGSPATHFQDIMDSGAVMHLVLCFTLGVHSKYPNQSYSIGTEYRGLPLFKLSTSSNHCPFNFARSSYLWDAIFISRFYQGSTIFRVPEADCRPVVPQAGPVLARLQPSTVSDCCSYRWRMLYHLISMYLR